MLFNRVNPWANEQPVTDPQTGLKNLQAIDKYNGWMLIIGGITTADVIICIICACVLANNYHPVNYWCAVGITLCLWGVLEIINSIPFYKVNRIIVSMQMSYYLRAKLVNINQGLFLCTSGFPILGFPFSYWCFFAFKKILKNAKEKISENEPFFVNDALNPNDPFNHQPQWWQKKKDDEQRTSTNSMPPSNN